MEAWTGNNVMNWFNCLLQFGRIGYVVKKDNIKNKMSEQGFTEIMVGYAANSPTGTYQMYNPYTKRIIFKSDIKWHVFGGENIENNPTIFNLL